MPIKIDPIDIEVEEVTKRTVIADKLHIISLRIADPTKGKPSIELMGVPYAEDANGNKQFGTEIVTIRTADLYGAIENLAGVGLNGMGVAMAAVFEAAAELVQYRTARQVEAKAAAGEVAKRRHEFEELSNDGNADPAALAAARDAIRAAMEFAGKAQAAVNDPANPRISM
jgi:hypothetical protein